MIGAVWQMPINAIVAMTSAATRNTLPGGVLCRPWPRFREVMARNRGVNDPPMRAVRRPRAPFQGRSRHGSILSVSARGRVRTSGRPSVTRLPSLWSLSGPGTAAKYGSNRTAQVGTEMADNWAWRKVRCRNSLASPVIPE